MRVFERMSDYVLDTERYWEVNEDEVPYETLVIQSPGHVFPFIKITQDLNRDSVIGYVCYEYGEAEHFQTTDKFFEDIVIQVFGDSCAL